MGWDDKVRDDCYFCYCERDPYYTRYICTLKDHVNIEKEQEKDCPCEVSKWEPDYECLYFISKKEITEALKEYLDYRLEEILHKNL